MSASTFLDGRVALEAGDCREVLQGYESNSFDSVVTDPPYALVSISKRFGKPGAAPAQHGKDGLYARASAGFMGKQWDTGETAFAVEFWAEVLRVLKPGGHVVAFSGTRTYHRMVCAIEDAGFEIRDQLAWTYGTGFNKRGYIHKDEAGKPVGPWGGALKPAWEPICLARKAIDGTVAENIERHGTGALNIDGCRIAGAFTSGWSKTGSKASANIAMSGANYDRDPKPDDTRGRWPANIIHDGSDDVRASFPETGGSVQRTGKRTGKRTGVLGDFLGQDQVVMGHDDAGGSAARFFYSAKADDDDRLGSKHPTVKPVDLMQWLCRLITPPGGLVLDPFAGTGSTGEAAWREGFRAVLIEREAEYQADIAKRMELCLAGPATRRAAIGAAKAERAPDLPLFAAE